MEGAYQVHRGNGSLATTFGAQRDLPWETGAGVEDRLSQLLGRILRSEYDSLEEFVAGSETYSLAELHAALGHVIAGWKAGQINVAGMYASLRFIYLYIDRNGWQLGRQNGPAIPVCYFSSYVPASALLLHSFLRTLSFRVMLFSLEETDSQLRGFVEQQKPDAAVITLCHFLDVPNLGRLVPYLRSRYVRVFAGGVPFAYDESLKMAFAACIFPRDLTELSVLLGASGRGRV